MRQVVTLMLLFAAGAVNFFDRASLSVANTTVRAEMHWSATQMGWLLSAFSLAYGFSQLPLLAILERFGTRRSLGAGLGIWSAAQMLTGLVRSLGPFLALRVLLGAGEAPFYPCGVHVVREWFPAEIRARATAFLNMSSTIAMAAAPPALTIIMLRVGWRWMFGLLGVAGLLVAAAWMAWYVERANLTSHRLLTPAPKNPSAWRVLLRHRTMWGMMLGWSGINYTVWLYTAWVPGYLESARHLGVGKSGWLAAIPFLFGAMGMALSGLMSDWVVRRGAPLPKIHRINLVVGMVLSAAGTLIVGRSQTTPIAIAGISAALFFVHFAGTSGWGYAQAMGADKYTAPIGALMNFASFIFASAAPVVTGWLLDRTHSFTLSLELCSGVMLLGALSYATLARPPREGTLAAGPEDRLLNA
ncbi:MAG TPA: MFS transporter [Acidobacteriaceae bacterium]|nr:MFS transporter [Acidobacteriaceae bacterium]